MSRFGKWPGFLSCGLCGMLLAAGCASTSKHRWLAFFFDGVPDTRRAPNQSSVEPLPAATTNRSPVQATAPAEPVMVVHSPYAERNCVACHESNYSQRLKDDVSRVCTGCHKAFLVQAKFIHAPVADGQCTLCHAAHQAREKFRLVKDSRELCFDCHDPDEVLRIRACGDAEDRVCTACHDPHQGNQRFLLRARAEKPSLVQNATPEK